jgi:CDP-glucose 4,6-dehydratase
MENPLGQRLRELPGPLLLTGHTGFKGTWMTFLLEHLNVPVVGYSLPAELDSLYDRVGRTGVIPEIFADIRDYKALENFIDLHKPSTIIHMAAQPLVLKSYESPRETFDVNVMGTVNVLDIAFKKDFVKAIVVITTDKVYRNDDSGKPFFETDPLEGKDPYSASKVGAEAVISAWQQISKVNFGPRIAAARAGNIIGGGDLGLDRLLPDFIRSSYFNHKISIRNPNGVRPWQHVLDVCVGYVSLLEQICMEDFYKAVNFGPERPSLTVQEVYEIASRKLSNLSLDISKDFSQAKSKQSSLEMDRLELDSTRARDALMWKPIYSQHEAIDEVINWWHRVLVDHTQPSIVMSETILNFLGRFGRA